MSVSAIGLSTINGVPAHILMVHFVVVLVPLAGFAVVLALRPAYAKRFGLALPALGVAAFASVLLAMNAGGWLQNHVQNTALVRRHTDLAGQLWPFSAVVGLLCIWLWWRDRRSATASQLRHNGGPKTVAIGVFVVLMAAASIVQVIRVGESGSRAAWNGRFSTTTVQQPRHS